MSGNELVGTVRTAFEWASLVIEVLGAGTIVAGVVKIMTSLPESSTWAQLPSVPCRPTPT